MHTTTANCIQSYSQKDCEALLGLASPINIVFRKEKEKKETPAKAERTLILYGRLGRNCTNFSETQAVGTQMWLRYGRRWDEGAEENTGAQRE